MSELSKAYEPQAVEAGRYQFWIRRGCFTADAASPRPAYSIVIPPPNVTGVLHIGHVLNNTIQDVLARKARMEGFEVLWLPGTDHAGIATQVVVEKMLRQEEKKTRHDLGREKFLERVWQWKEKHGGIIIEQLKKLGCSCDWSRERFTMDPAYSRRVAETFVDLYQKGLIYRGWRIVNWCPASQTALSDEEVIMKPQNGFLYYFRVEVEEQPGRFLTIATTRPETIPGDAAIAVNPRDPRYQDLAGLHALRPLPRESTLEERRIPIVADELVDFEFGTGVLKVTPAHDKADFEIGQRHKLAPIEVIDASGRMTDKAGRDLAGQDRFKARKLAVEILQETGALEKQESYQNSVGFSERADVPIEPRLSEQWFLRYPSQESARRVAANGELRFFPDRWAKVYDHWLANIQDWCISRQLWWGHQIPVWYRGDEVRCQVDSPGPDWRQDPDVLDTWFSSWLWPFATMDEKTRAKFYPTTALVTAPEILFFWVARMIMAGFEYTSEKPFRDVYLTGIVRDKLGRKMSKSLGNSPDPLKLIATYGADALRFGVLRSAPLGQDVLFDEQQVELGRNFCNKLWNACRFRQMQGGEVGLPLQPGVLSGEDRWILARLDAAITETSAALAEYKFNDAAQTLYRFFWSEYCDWYIEATKSVLMEADSPRKANTLAVLDFVLQRALRLFHPFIPFITEELWHGLGFNAGQPEDPRGQTILFSEWPKRLDMAFKTLHGIDEEAVKWVEAKFELVTLGRNLRRESNIPSNKKAGFVFKPAGAFAAEETEVLRLLLGAESFTIDSCYAPPKGTPSARSGLGELYLPLEGLVDVEAEKARLDKELRLIEAEIEKAAQKLNNPNFAQKAPPQVLAEHRQRLADWQAKRAQIMTALDGLSNQ